MTRRPLLRLLAGAASILFAATACGGGTPGPGGTTPATSTSGEGVLGTGGPADPSTTASSDPGASPSLPPGERMPASWVPCDRPQSGYSIGYPGDWHAATGEWQCQFFHPDPFTIPENSEFPPLALNAAQTTETVASYRAAMTDPTSNTVLRNEDVTVLDRPGVRFETVSLGLGLDEVGTRRYGYIIDSGGGQAFVVWTIGRVGETRYDDWKFVVDIARSSVRFLH